VTLAGFCRCVEALSRAAGWLAAALILGSVLVICQMLFVRFVLGQSAIWQNEFVTFAMIGATFMGAPWVLSTGGHVNVDLLSQHLGPWPRRRLALLAHGLGLVFCAVVLLTSIGWWWEAWSLGFRTSTLWRARLWIPYAAIPLGSLLLVLQYIVEIRKTVGGTAADR
jgi:TRAP-type C4-dicarboxylate transport system permease small subunit